MTVFFSPDGTLNLSADASDLPDGAMVRAKNVRLNERGKARVRDGSVKLNATAISTPVWWIEEQSGDRYAFAAGSIFRNESSITSGLTNAQWAAVQYNAFNSTTEAIFALNGTDRKRIEGSSVYEWGLAAPTTAPVLSVGQGTGLTGSYNVRYTYLRKEGSVVVAESNPSPSATNYIVLSDQSLAVDIAAPSDSQVTHARIYRTLSNGATYYHDQDIPVAGYGYGYSEDFEADDGYITGTGYKFTQEDAGHGTENCYTWEARYEDSDESDGSGYGGGEWWINEDGTIDEAYISWLVNNAFAGVGL